jgi:tetratricopeptide (TPR) repeat protein
MQSRMDRLSVDDRKILCAASVIGQRFSLEAAMMLAGIEVYDERSLVQALHARAAHWFKGHDILLEAEHLEKAKSPHAAAEFRQELALDLANRGLALDPSADTRIDLLLLRGDVARDLGQGDASLEAFRTALAESVSVGHRLAARIGMISTMRILDQLEDAERIIAEAEQTDPTPALLPHLSKLHYLKGSLAFPRGDFKGCLAAHSTARALAKRAAEPELEARALSGLGDAYYAQGRMFRAYEVVEDCLALCEMHHLTAVEAANRFMRGTVRIYMNQTEAALDDALKSAALASPRDQQTALLAEGEALLAQGCVGHNDFRFNVYAGMCAGNAGDVAGLRRYCDALDAYTRDEPTPWSDFYVATGRAIADQLEGDTGAAERLRDLRKIASAASLNAAVRRIDALLN